MQLVTALVALLHFLSHALTVAERNYPVYERELLAMVLALPAWRHHLQGSIYCNSDRSMPDEETKKHIMSHDQDRGRLVCLQRFLSTFNLQINYIPDTLNVIAGALSRRPDLRSLLLATVAASREI
jgi:hypothetical protein